MRRCLTASLIALCAALAAPDVQASGAITPGTVAPNFTKNVLGGGSRSLSDDAGKVVVLFLFGYACPICQTDGPSVQANLNQYFQAMYPGQVSVVGVDLWDGSPAQVQSFKNVTGATYPLLMLGASANGGNLDALYGPFDNYVVINKQGIVRYHAGLTWPHGNRYHLDEIRGCVDSLVTNLAGVGDPRPVDLRLSASPSPFRSLTTISLAAPAGEPARARIVVHDVSGRRVASLFDGPIEAEGLRVTWDGRADRGGRVAPGLYLVTADVGARRVQRRVVLLQ